MSVTMEYLARHSSAKDHIAMTGGTLSADKVVRGDAPLVLQRFFFPVVGVRLGVEAEEALARIYAGIHSIEHALASPEGGDLRARLDEIGRESGLGKRLIDMSPYVPGLLRAGGGTEVVVGFRLTFVSDGGLLERDVIAAAYERSLQIIRELFVQGAAVPFSTPEECGQYDMHSAAAAVELIDGVRRIEAEVGVEGGAGAGSGDGVDAVEVGARELYVCDLRLVKPRLPGAFEQRMLDVLGGHVISQVVEATAWTSLTGAQAGTVAAGNFGCSTGEYLMVGNPRGLGREVLLRDAHVAVARTLMELAGYEGADTLRRVAAGDARFAAEQVRRYGGGVWDEAVDAASVVS